MNDAPYISVVIAVLNRAQTLEQAITSVTCQTFQSKELLVIDGGSTDGSVEVIKENSENIAYWISEPDNGIYQAWNKALKVVKGKWVIFLGADDYFWDNKVLEEVSGRLKKIEQNVGIFYGLVNIVNFNGLALFTVGKDWMQSKKEFKTHNTIPHQAAFHRNRLFKQYGGFDESLQIAGDYDFLLRVLNKEEVYFCDELIVTAMRHGGVSSTFKTARLRLKEDYLIKKKHGLRIINYYWLRRVCITYLRELLRILVGEKKVYEIELRARKLIMKQSFWDHI